MTNLAYRAFRDESCWLASSSTGYAIPLLLPHSTQRKFSHRKHVYSLHIALILRYCHKSLEEIENSPALYVYLLSRGFNANGLAK